MSQIWKPFGFSKITPEVLCKNHLRYPAINIVLAAGGEFEFLWVQYNFVLIEIHYVRVMIFNKVIPHKATTVARVADLDAFRPSCTVLENYEESCTVLKNPCISPKEPIHCQRTFTLPMNPKRFSREPMIHEEPFCDTSFLRVYHRYANIQI